MKTTEEFLATLPSGSARYWRKEIERRAQDGWKGFRMVYPNQRYRVTRPSEVIREQRKAYVYVFSPSSGGRWGRSRNDYVETTDGDFYLFPALP